MKKVFISVFEGERERCCEKEKEKVKTKKVCGCLREREIVREIESLKKFIHPSRSRRI